MSRTNDGHNADEGRRREWRSTITRLCFMHRCAPDEVEIRITLTLDGDPQYAILIKGVEKSSTNSISMVTGRL